MKGFDSIHCCILVTSRQPKQLKILSRKFKAWMKVNQPFLLADDLLSKAGRHSILNITRMIAGSYCSLCTSSESYSSSVLLVQHISKKEQSMTCLIFAMGVLLFYNKEATSSQLIYANKLAT